MSCLGKYLYRDRERKIKGKFFREGSRESVAAKVIFELLSL